VRLGLLLSSLFHAVVILSAVVALPSPDEFKVEKMEALPVDLLTVAEFTKLAAKSPLALQIGKAGIYGIEGMPYDRALDYAGELFASLCSTQDAREGVQAFVEGREPVWHHR